MGWDGIELDGMGLEGRRYPHPFEITPPPARDSLPEGAGAVTK